MSVIPPEACDLYTTTTSLNITYGDTTLGAYASGQIATDTVCML
jgi:hypothetical protein